MFSNQVFYALVEGFAALGSVVGFFSALSGFVALARRDTAEAIGQAINYGIVYGFIPGALLGGYIFVAAATTLH